MKACVALTTGADTQLLPDKCELTYLLCLGPIPALHVLLAAGWGGQQIPSPDSRQLASPPDPTT